MMNHSPARHSLISLSVGARRLLFDSAVTVAGVGVAASAFTALRISDHAALVGVMEHGYRPEILIALTADAVTVISLTRFLTLAERHRRLLRARAVTRGGPARGAAGSTAHGAR